MSTFTGDDSKAPHVAEQVGHFQSTPPGLQEAADTGCLGKTSGRNLFRQRTGVRRITSKKVGLNLCHAQHAVLPWSCKAQHFSDTFGVSLASVSQKTRQICVMGRTELWQQKVTVLQEPAGTAEGHRWSSKLTGFLRLQTHSEPHSSCSATNKTETKLHVSWDA